MKKNTLRKFSSLILIAAMIMTLAAGCGKKEVTSTSASTSASVSASTTETSKEEVVSTPTEEKTEPETQEEAQKKSFTFIAIDKDGNETKWDISTDKKTVGEALSDEKLIEGTESEYGLYVTKVNGIEALYEVDQTYWAFYINGEYAMTGVDSTDVEDGATYTFKVEG